jgi:dTDP-4-dehydrorhamnose reductase
MFKIFITGESGTIPMAMQRLASSFGFEIINTQLEDNFLTSFKTHQSFKVRKPEMDFLNRDFLLKTDMWKQVNLIIHSGAYVGTDYCSSDPGAAIRTNVEGTQNIVDICNKFSIPLIYLSTTAILNPKDYSRHRPMSEFTAISPQTLYGITKYAGELIVQNICKTRRIIVRPVFGFGNYPEDLHSALTKIIYVIYRNLIGKETKLTVLLNKEIMKSYTRVENIATCILKFANVINQADIFHECSLINIGENYEKAKDWYDLLDLISYQFITRGICSHKNINVIFNKHITFVPEKDYLHYHNLDNSRLKSLGFDFDIQKNYINIETGISLTLDSVIKNIEQEPYWL